MEKAETIENGPFKTTVSGIANYVKYWLDEYRKDPRNPEVPIKLQVVFALNSPYQVKILDGNVFARVFYERLGVNRLRNLRRRLLEIYPKGTDEYGRYETVRFEK